MIKLAHFFLAVVESQIDNERGSFCCCCYIKKMSKPHVNKYMDSAMHVYHNYPNEVIEKLSAPSFAEISNDQTRSGTLKRYISEMIDAEIDLLIDVEGDSTVTECK